MKQYDTDFLESFESIDTKSPHSQKKEINGTYQAVMKEAGLRKNTPSIKKSGRILLLVAAIAAFTVVTAAAYAFGAGNLFKGFFESNGSKVNGAKPTVSLSESQVAKINEAGTLLNKVATNNGTTVEIRAAVGDKSCAYILLDVTAPKGTVLNKDKYEFADMPIDFHNALPKAKTGGGGSSSISWDISTQKDEIPNDNKKSFVIKINCAGIDLQNRDIQMTLKDLSLPSGKLAYTTVVKGEWKFDLKLGYSTVSKNIQVNKVTHYSDDYSTIQTVGLSTLSASVRYTNRKSQGIPSMIVRLKDGTESTILPGSGCGSGQDGFVTAYQFAAPLDFDKVAKITLGDVGIPIE